MVAVHPQVDLVIGCPPYQGFMLLTCSAGLVGYSVGKDSAVYCKVIEALDLCSVVAIVRL
jgi:hypothetical protein